MEVVRIIMTIIGALLVAIGVIFIFDARKIIVKNFGIGDRNAGAKGLKFLGAGLIILGFIVVYFNLR